MAAVGQVLPGEMVWMCVVGSSVWLEGRVNGGSWLKLLQFSLIEIN